MAKIAKWRQLTNEEFANLVAESRSFQDLAQKIGYEKTGGGTQTTLKNAVKERNLDTSHFLGQGWKKDNFDYDRFKYGNTLKAVDARNALISLRGHKCEMCELTKWQDVLIPLEVHHEDGDHLNNELDNLKLLCPNCHALTKNWRGKNISKKDCISEEDFVNALNNNVSIRQALLSLGLTGAGGNYERAYQLINQYNIQHLKK